MHELLRIRTARPLFVSLLVSVSILPLFQTPLLAMPQVISFEWLPDLTNTERMFPRRVNSYGDFVGTYSRPGLSQTEPTAFTYINDTFLRIQPSTFSSHGTGINDDRQAVGYWYNGFHDVGFVQTFGGGRTNVDLAEFSTRLYDINENGVQTGFRNIVGDDPNLYYFLRPGGDVVGEILGGENAINDNGVIAAVGGPNSQSENGYYFTSDENGVQNLGRPGFLTYVGHVHEINNERTFVGLGYNQDAYETAFYHDGSFKQIPALPGHLYNEAYGIDEDGNIVGESYNFDGGAGAFVYTADQQLFDLNDVAAAHLDGGHLNTAADIAENGWVVGYGNYPNGGMSVTPFRMQLKFGGPTRIVLAFTQDANAAIAAENVFGQDVAVVNGQATLEAYDSGTNAFANFQQTVRDLVEDHFLNSGDNGMDVENVEVVVGDPEPGAANIFFVERDQVAIPGLEGRAYTGIGQFNHSAGGEAFVLMEGQDVLTGAAKIAEVTAHEAGHLLGLIHVDPPGASVMDYDPSPGSTFQNGTFALEEPPGSNHMFPSVTHNPLYHLLRYVDQKDPIELADAGIFPGTWDTTPSSTLGVVISSNLVSPAEPLLGGLGGAGGEPLTLYDVQILEADSDPLAPLLLATFDAITLDELGGQQFLIGGTSALMLLAASMPGGETDVAIALGNPYEAGGLALYPGFGMTAGFLQMEADNPEGYVTLATIVLNVTLIPEPTSAALLLVGLVCIGRQRRRC